MSGYLKTWNYAINDLREEMSLIWVQLFNFLNSNKWSKKRVIEFHCDLVDLLSLEDEIECVANNLEYC